jgi:hypothetical protein
MSAITDAFGVSCRGNDDDDVFFGDNPGGGPIGIGLVGSCGGVIDAAAAAAALNCSHECDVVLVPFDRLELR